MEQIVAAPGENRVVADSGKDGVIAITGNNAVIIRPVARNNRVIRINPVAIERVDIAGVDQVGCRRAAHDAVGAGRSRRP